MVIKHISFLSILVLTTTADAAIYRPQNTTQLIADINTANGTLVDDIIDLGNNIFALSGIDNNLTNGPNGLPIIASEVTSGKLSIINGAIEGINCDIADDFRIFEL